MLAAAKAKRALNCSSALRFFSSKKKAGYGIEEAIKLLRDRVGRERDEVKIPLMIANIKLNLKPLKHPSHKLKGVFDLPHGTGKVVEVAALTTDEDLERYALDAGALFAGDIVDDIINTQLIKPILMQRRLPPVQSTFFRRLVATTDMAPICTGDGHKLARTLKKFLMVPSVEERTLVEPRDFVEAVEKHASGKYHMFHVEKGGLVFCNLGKVGLAEPEHFVKNLHYAMKELYARKPKDFDDKDRDLVHSIHLGTALMGAVPLDIGQYIDYWRKPNKNRRSVEQPGPRPGERSVIETSPVEEEETRSYRFLR